jgi:DNA-binding transcriptional regulator GbsR (MarR family)
MGQQDIFDSLRKNPNQFFSAEELSKILKVNRQSVSATLRKLNNKGDIVVKLFSIGRNNTPLKKFCFVNSDAMFEIVDEYNQVRAKYINLNSDLLSNLMIVKEIREMRKNGNKK